MVNSVECAAKHLCTAPANATLGNHFCCKCGMHVHSVFCSDEVEALPSEIKLVFDPCKQLGSFKDACKLCQQTAAPVLATARSSEGEEEDLSMTADAASGTQEVSENKAKCSVRGCKLGKTPTLTVTCAANELNGCKKCERVVHIPCYENLVVKSFKGESLPADEEQGNMSGKVFCTVGCYRRYIKANAGGSNWHNDGANGCDDVNCSENLLVNRFLSREEEYSKYRGPPCGLTKIDICNKWAEEINSHGVKKKRTGKDVQNKITAIESQMKIAQDFADTETGQGLQDGTRFGSWEEAITSRCKFWNDLHPIFIQRASMKPTVTTEDILKSSEDDVEDSESPDVYFGTDEGGFSMSDEQDEGSEMKQQKKKKKTSFLKTRDLDKTKTPIRTPTGKRGSIDQTLETLLSFKLEEMKHKQRKREREQAKENRRKLEDYDLTDCDQWIEFAARFNAIKETFGGDAVRAALQFPRFAETSLLTAEEKREFENQRTV
jgi:hypothetical protein